MSTTRYTIKFDARPRTKVRDDGYRSLSEAMHTADRAVISGSCTVGEVYSPGPGSRVVYTATREQIKATLATWTQDQIRYWKGH